MASTGHTKGELRAREIAPAPDPWAVARRLAHLPHVCFLDSADRHGIRGRYSYVMADPAEWFIASDFPAAERLAIRGRRADPNLPPFQGGWVGLLGYGLNRTLEAIPKSRVDDLPVPDSAWGRYETVFAWDHAQNRCWLIGDDHSENDRASGTKSTAAVSPLGLPTHKLSAFPHADVRSHFSPAEYRHAVARAIEYVHAGDVFQVNLAQRLVSPLRESPLDVYGRLREQSPAPFAAYFDLGDQQILSASPEQFLKVDADRHVITRPIKGTRPRGQTPAEDERLKADLISNAKDRAENVMIVDLMRNDIGRVCEFGSVQVSRLCEVESHNYVHHLVSEVRGRLKSDRTAIDLLKSCFPGGSVTGAPKVRAMEIIAELEPTARGPYCGSLVWLGHDGAIDSNILIRTMTAANGWLQFPVGGGIVADSKPESEYAETLHKAAGMVRALQKTLRNTD